MMVRLMSPIISNKRLLDGPIAKYGIQVQQFGSQPLLGCRDAIFTLRSMLELRTYHNLPIWALNVDLVKAFNSFSNFLRSMEYLIIWWTWYDDLTMIRKLN